MTDDSYWILHATINDGQADALIELIDEMVAATREETGAKSYEWHRNGNSLHIYERYASPEDSMIHLGNFQTKFAERFLTCLTVDGIDVYGLANDDLRAALGALGAVFHDQVGGFDR